jgi:hypothetical protein
MEDNVDALHFADELVAIPHIGQEKGCFGMVVEMLLESEEFAFIVVEGHYLCDCVGFKQLMDQLPADGPACARHQNPLIVQRQSGLPSKISAMP